MRRQESIDFLVGEKVDLNAQDESGETALYSAVTWLNYGKQSALISHGADPSIRNDEGRSPLRTAINHSLYTVEDKVAVIQNLLRSGWVPSDGLYLYQAGANDVRLLQTLLDGGVSPELSIDRVSVAEHLRKNGFIRSAEILESASRKNRPGSCDQLPKLKSRDQFPIWKSRVPVVRGNYDNGEEAGWWSFFYANGKTAGEGLFMAGRESGEWRYYHENGEQRAIGRFDEGCMTGPWRFWTESGRIDSVLTGTCDWNQKR